MHKLLFLIPLLAIACIEENLNKANIESTVYDSTAFFIKDEFGAAVGKEKVDSLMWTLYALNYKNIARHLYDKNAAVLDPVQCGFFVCQKKCNTQRYY